MSPEPEETEVETTESEVQQEPEKPRRIEIDPEELKEMRETLRRQSEELHQHKLWQMQQYQQNQRPADIQVDPDVERVIAPVVRKALQPLEERNRQLEAQLNQNAEQLRVRANIDYLERNIDNFEEIRPDIAKKIESLPKAEQDKIAFKIYAEICNDRFRLKIVSPKQFKDHIEFCLLFVEKLGSVKMVGTL